MTKWMRKTILIMALTPCMVMFQNCSGGFSQNPFDGASTEQGGGDDDGGAPTTTLPPTTTTSTTLPGNVGSPDDLFVALGASGTVNFTMHPGNAVSLNQNTTVIFGLAFPKGTVTSLSNIRILNQSGQEVSSRVREINSWRNPTTLAAESLHGVEIAIQVNFTNRNPVVYQAQWGQARTLNLNIATNAQDTWVAMSGSDVNPTEYPSSGNVREPSVYVTLPASWLTKSLIKTRMTAQNEIAGLEWYDTRLEHYAGLGRETSNGYAAGYEPWLYDRALTFFIAYTRTGKLQWLQAAHRAAQYYNSLIRTPNGDFSLRTGDAKFVYSQSLVADMMVTGDLTLKSRIELVTTPHANWATTYTTSIGFWTERNAAYALHAALGAYDATGSATYANRAKALFTGFFNHQQTPPNGWPKIGCPLHTKNQHDPSEDIPDVMCSPWMGALMADAIWRYYLMFDDTRALAYLADFADYIVSYGLYSQGGSLLPYYGATHVGTSPIDGDREHTCDVFGALIRGAWAKREIGRSTANLTTAINGLKASCQANLTTAGASPPRKMNWWFSTTPDMTWFLRALSF